MDQDPHALGDGPRGGAGGGRRDQHHEESFFGGDEHFTVPESVQNEGFQHVHARVALRETVGKAGQDDLVRPAEVEPEWFGAFHDSGDIGVAAQQVVDQFTAQRFFLPDQLLGGGLVAVDEDGDGFTDSAKYRLCRGTDGVTIAVRHDVGQVPPHPPGRGQVEVHDPSGRDALLGGATAELTDDRQFVFTGPPPGDGGVREQGEVLDQQLQRRLRVSGGCLRDRRQPGFIRSVRGAGARPPQPSRLAHATPLTLDRRRCWATSQ